MSLRSKFFSTLSLSVGIAAFSTAAIAQETTTIPSPDKVEKRLKGDKLARKAFDARHGKQHGKMHGLRGINLTDAQKAQVKAIRESISKPDQATITELRTIREARKAGTAITPEQQARIKSFREQSKARAKSVHEQVLAILTPEQKARIETRKADMRQRMEQRRTERKLRTAPLSPEKPIIN